MTTMSDTTSSPIVVALCWTLVGIPLAYGVYMTVLEAVGLFTA
jgi:hypothetical protein